METFDLESNAKWELKVLANDVFVFLFCCQFFFLLLAFRFYTPSTLPLFHLIQLVLLFCRNRTDSFKSNQLLVSFFLSLFFLL